MKLHRARQRFTAPQRCRTAARARHQPWSRELALASRHRRIGINVGTRVGTGTWAPHRTDGQRGTGACLPLPEKHQPQTRWRRTCGYESWQRAQQPALSFVDVTHHRAWHCTAAWHAGRRRER